MSLAWECSLLPYVLCVRMFISSICSLRLECNFFPMFSTSGMLISSLKVHKPEIILNFFWPKSNPYIPLVNFQKNFCFFSFDFRQNFEVRTFSRWLSIRGTKFFWRDIQKFFFLKMLTWVPIDGFLNGFSKFGFFIVEICILMWDFWIIFENYNKRMLSIRGNNFIAHWAY